MTSRINALAGVLLLLAGVAGVASAQTPGDVQKIVAVVNDEIISEYDVKERMQLITSTTGALRNQDEYDQLRKTVIQLLVDEKLQLQEAKEQKINITDADVQQRFNEMAQRNNMAPAQFNQELARMGASKDMIMRQVKAGLAWEEVINARLRPFLAIGDGEVKAYLDNLKNNKGQPEYRIGEIFLAVDSPDKDAEAHQTADRLVRQIREGAEFAAVARQFSDVATGAVGGDTGWTIGDHINPDIKDTVLKLQEGQVSDPIRTTAGYYIVSLLDQRQVLSADPDDTQIDLQQIIVKAGADQNAQRQHLAQQAATLSDCGNVGQLAGSMGATDTNSLGTVRLGDLPPPVKKVVRPLEVGHASEPVLTGSDFRVLVVCGKKVAEVKEPSPSEIEDFLSNQRLAMMARRYLRDLRRDAIIDYK